MTESCRLITTEQYQEYQKLKEEHKPISWSELKEEAKKMGYKIEKYYTEELIKQISEEAYVTFDECGSVVSTYKGWCVSVDITISEHRTPDQMLSIMKALHKEEE